MTDQGRESVQQRAFPWSKEVGIEPGETLLTTQEVATYLRVTSQTLTKWRKEGDGPQFIRLGEGQRGRIVYRWSDLVAWLDAHGNRRSGRTVGSLLPGEQESKGAD
jgi:hypothetical protein